MNLFFRFFITGVVIGLMLSAAQAQEKKINRAQLPPAVEATVARESAGATIKGLATEIEHGHRFYEASLIVDGHSKDILIVKNAVREQWRSVQKPKRYSCLRPSISRRRRQLRAADRSAA